MGYTLNFSHLVGIMIISTLSDHPRWRFEVRNIGQVGFHAFVGNRTATKKSDCFQVDQPIVVVI